jgi:hypothetical protein
MDTTRDIPLGDHFLHIEPEAGGHVLRLVGPGGAQRLEIAVTADGPVLRLHSGLKLELAGALTIDAQTVALHGREGLALTSGADARITAAGDLVARAELGDVSVRANDDVRLDGERVRMNC